MEKKLSRRYFLSNGIKAAAIGALSTRFLSGCCKLCGEGKKYKIAVCDWSLGNKYQANPEAFDFAKSIGFDGVQVSSKFAKGKKEFFTKDQISAYKDKMSKLGMEVASTSPSGMSFLNDADSVEFTKSAVEASAALGGKAILLPFFGKDKMSGEDFKMREEFFAPLVSKLKEVSPRAEELGIDICLENTLSSEENIRVMEAVGSPNVKVYFDTMNIEYYGHDAVPSILKLKGRIGEIHLKNIAHKLDASQNSMPKDFAGCLKAIRDIGYEGWLTLELHAHNPAKDGSVESVLRHNVQYLRDWIAKV